MSKTAAAVAAAAVATAVAAALTAAVAASAVAASVVAAAHGQQQHQQRTSSTFRAMSKTASAWLLLQYTLYLTKAIVISYTHSKKSFI